jgi:lipoate-protein ligase B
MICRLSNSAQPTCIAIIDTAAGVALAVGSDLRPFKKIVPPSVEANPLASLIAQRSDYRNAEFL